MGIDHPLPDLRSGGGSRRNGRLAFLHCLRCEGMLFEELGKRGSEAPEIQGRTVQPCLSKQQHFLQRSLAGNQADDGASARAQSNSRVFLFRLDALDAGMPVCALEEPGKRLRSVDLESNRGTAAGELLEVGCTQVRR